MVSQYEGLDDWQVTTLRAAKSVARRLRHSSRGITDLDDLVYTAFTWALENENKVKFYIDEERVGLLKTRLYRVMQKSLAKERAAVTGASTHDAFYYTASAVEEILTSAWDAPSMASQSDGLPAAKGLANEGGNREAMRVDVLRALTLLPDDLILMLRQRYQMNLTYDEIGSLHELKGDTARKRTERAVITMLDLLGGSSPWAKRRSRSNAAAQAETSADYGGE